MSNRSDETAVLLVDFGSALEAASIRNYLKSIFSDPHIVGNGTHPKLRAVTTWIIAMSLNRKTKKRCDLICGRISPARERNELAQRLGDEIGVNVTWATRHASPDIESKLTELVQSGCKQVVVVPLFPQCSWSMTESIVSQCRSFMEENKIYGCTFKFVKSWLDAPSFVSAWARTIQAELDDISSDTDVHLVYSAHAIPMRHVRMGCCYLGEVARSVELIHNSLSRSYPMHIAYQSKGRWGGWSGPRLERTLKHLSNQGVRDCLIVPISFVFENLETLIDLDLELVPRFRRLGINGLRRIQTPGRSQEVINTLAELVQNSIRLSVGHSDP